MPNEFDLIRRYFDRPAPSCDLAVGDDAALLRPAAGLQLAVSTDLLIEGIHFLADAEPRALGWKAMAVNVSDIAAMGARPKWATLALSLPDADERWLDGFAAGFFECCSAFGVDLIGGDTTRGPLTITVTIIGELPAGTAILRSGARAGHDLWVSGQPGRAALALRHLLGSFEIAPAAREECLAALHRPQPRLALGRSLRGIASAMLDVSDGLLGDLGHILAASSVGALIDEERLPLAALHRAGASASTALDALLRGGDDYELLFAAPPTMRAQVGECARRCGLPAHRIGQLTPAPETLIMRGNDGHERRLEARGYDHFGRDSAADN